MRNRAAWAIWWGLAWITPAMADETLVIYCSEHTPPKHYAEAGVAKGYAVEAARMVDPEPRVSEMDDSIRYLEERRLILRIPTELGDSVSLTPDGVHWYHIHR